MLVGCPVIASRISDNEQLLQNGRLGSLCNPYIPNDICSSLIKFSEISEQEKRKIVKCARVFSVSELSIKKLSDSFENLLIADYH